MAQHDMSIANQGFPAFRSDLNDALQALVSQNSGATAPSTTFANMPWYDTANNIFKMRNEDNDAWISIFTLNQTTDAITAVGSVTLADLLDTADIGTTVQAYDSNLTSFVSTFTLPTSDGSANQALVTNGSGTIGFASVTANEVGFRNRIINGAMVISQRDTSFTSVGNGTSAPQYTLDRVFGYRGSGWTANLDVSQQTGFGQFQNCIRAQRTSGTSSTAVMVIGQIIESVNMFDLQGQSVTLSFLCRSGSNFSGGTVSPQFYFSTSANQSSASLAVGTWAGQTIASTTITPTTTATQYTYTATVPSNALSMAVLFLWTPSGTAGANDFLEFSGVQLEKGSTATSFDYRPYGTELALCQRYYQTRKNGFAMLVQGPTTGNNTYISAAVPFIVTMRSSPTMTFFDRSNTSGQITILTGGSSMNGTDLAGPYGSSATADYVLAQTYNEGTRYGFRCGFTASAEL